MATFTPHGYSGAKKELISRIEGALNQLPDCTFYIGIATNVVERYPDENDRKDLSVLFYASTIVVRMMESDLIAHFGSDDSPFAKRCRNERGGGGGTDTATLLYIKLDGHPRTSPETTYDERYFPEPIIINQ